jgi:hypothetical protein
MDKCDAPLRKLLEQSLHTVIDRLDFINSRSALNYSRLLERNERRGVENERMENREAQKRVTLPSSIYRAHLLCER